MKIGKFELNLSLIEIKVVIPRLRLAVSDAFVIGLGVFISVFSYTVFSHLNLVVAYNDARAHMNMARLVYDNLKPGLVQIGSVWLPLDHILKLAFVWNDNLWQSGFAGSIWSMISYSATVFVIYKFILKVINDNTSAFIGTLVFAMNLNVIYMQSTPMTELLLLFFFTSSSYFLYLWSLNKKTHYLIPVAITVFFATLTRYDGWFLFIVIIGILFVISIRDTFKKIKNSKDFKSTLFSYLERRLVVFTTLGGLGIVLWFLWNLLIFGDSLYFALGPYSARSQQNKIAASGSLLTKGNILLSVKAYWLSMVDNVGLLLILFSILGLIFYIYKNKVKDTSFAVYSLLSPFFFHVVSLFVGFSILVVPELGAGMTSEAKTSWFNVRYGLMILPAVAFFAAYLTRKKFWLKVLLLILIVFESYVFYSTQNIITITDGVIGTSSLDVTDVRDWLVANAKSKPGLILTSISYNNALAFSTGIPLKRFIHEGTGKFWKDSLVDPTLDAKWIVMANGDVGDPVYTALFKKHNGEFLKYYVLKMRAKHTNIYELRKPSRRI